MLSKRGSTEQMIRDCLHLPLTTNCRPLWASVSSLVKHLAGKEVSLKTLLVLNYYYVSTFLGFSILTCMPVINTANQCDRQTIVQGTNLACGLFSYCLWAKNNFYFYIYIMFLFLLFFYFFATCIPVINTAVPCYEQTIVQGTNLACGLFFYCLWAKNGFYIYIYRERTYIKNIYSIFILLFFATLHIFNHCTHTHT